MRRQGISFFLTSIVACLTLLSTTSEARCQSGSVDSATASAPMPYPVASGQMATSSLSASATAPTKNYVKYTGPTWSWSATGASVLNIVQPDNTKAAATLQATISSPGLYAITATATATWQGSDGSSISASKSASPVAFIVVGVKTLQYLDPVDGYVNAGTLYVLHGHSVTFKALPTPDGSSFPDGNPVWSGTSGASGTDQINTVTFPTVSTSISDFKTVTATWGNTKLTANVIVYDLIPTISTVTVAR